MNGIVDLLPIALLGGLLGLDVVSFPQAMLSRPLVAATLAGALLGQPLQGLLAGVVLELFALETLPVGASRYPEWGSASVVGGALLAMHAAPAGGALATATLGGLATAWIGGWTMLALRRLNASRARRLRVGLARGDEDAVVGLQLFGMTADFARGAVLTLVALVLLVPLARAAVALWSLDPRLSRAITVGIAAAVAAGATWKVFHVVRGAHWYFLGGAVLGLVLLGMR